jgi:hypothetical protein
MEIREEKEDSVEWKNSIERENERVLHQEETFIP